MIIQNRSNVHQKNQRKARIFAFYLPQFHPIPENNEWWGQGFTEWTNVAKAKPLFKSHYQPRVPSTLSFYDLRLAETREAQAELAKNHGVEGFVYWHYWFAGKRLLERPFNEVLSAKKPNFPFCLAWANESWTGIWHGNPGKILIEQTYPGVTDYEQHFYALLEAFSDERYLKIEGKSIFYIYKPFDIPDVKVFIEKWNELAKRNNISEFYFIARVNSEEEIRKSFELGYNAVQTNWLGFAMNKISYSKHFAIRALRKLTNNRYSLDVWDYGKLGPFLTHKIDQKTHHHPTILTGWDNSPRSGTNGRILVNYTPDEFEKHLQRILEISKKKNPENNIIFLRSWNEWAEGNYIEPDLKFGHQFLEKLKQNVMS